MTVQAETKKLAEAMFRLGFETCRLSVGQMLAEEHGPLALKVLEIPQPEIPKLPSLG